MPKPQYTIAYDGSPGRTLAELRIDSASLQFRVMDFATLSLVCDRPFDGAALFGSGKELKLYDPGGACRFVGEVVATPLDSDVGSGASHRYTARCHLGHLARMQYTQTANAYVDISGTPTLRPCAEPRVTLGKGMTNAAQVAEILRYAIGKGVPVALQDSPQWPEGAEVPADERENITCWEAILAMLRWTPDHIMWVDYSTGAPVVNLRQQELMSSVPFGERSAQLMGVSFNPRHDIIMTGLNIFYRRIDNFDGMDVESRYVDSAGDYEDPMATSCYIDLQGGSQTRLSQDVEVAPLPGGYMVDEWAREWLRARVGWLDKLDWKDWEIRKASKIATRNLPNELIKGQLYKWMTGVHLEQQIINFEVAYKIRKDGEIIDEAVAEVPIPIMATDAVTKTYSTTGSMESGEDVPHGLAAAIFAAWSVLQWDGSFRTDIGKVGWIVPGMRVNITGGPAALATMGAVVQESSVTLEDGTLEVSCGTTRMLECNTLVGLYRALRNFRLSYKANTDPLTGGVNPDLKGGEAFPASGGGGASPALERNQFAVIKDSKKVSISPGELTVESGEKKIALKTDGLEDGQTVEVREITIVTDVASNTKSKYKVLATTGIGEESPKPPPCGNELNRPQDDPNAIGGWSDNVLGDDPPSPPCAIK